MEEKNFLKYGDVIILQTKSFLQSPSFLAARSLLEEDIHFIQTQNDALGIVYYDNFNECEFKILPLLRYEACKNLRKALKDKQLSSEKLEIIRKRVENEQIKNKAIIEKQNGKIIHLGDDVLLQHVYSQCYVKCYETNKVQTSTMSELKLTKSMDSGIIFVIKIDPYFTFKKDGDKISYEDSFYFLNKKQGGSIYFDHTQKMPKHVLSKKNSGINFPSIMEFNGAYNIYKAGHVKNKILTFKAIKVTRNIELDDPATQEIEKAGGQGDSQDDNHIHWGDLVRISHILRNSILQKVSMESSINVSGFLPNLFLTKRENQTKQESLNSIFQILPDNPDLLGEVITAGLNKNMIGERYEYPDMIFRHWLTGKFFSLKDIDKGFMQELLPLQPSINEFLENRNIDLNKKVEAGSQPGQPGRRKSVAVAKLSALGSGGEDACIQKYINSLKIKIQPIQQDDILLTTKSCFSMEWAQCDEAVPQKINSLKVKTDNVDQKTLIQPSTDEWLSQKYFQNNFKKQNYDKKTYYTFDVGKNKPNQKDNVLDFFFLEPVSMDHISYCISITSRLYSFVQIISNPLILYEIATQSKDKYCQNHYMILQNTNLTLIKMCFWLCDFDDVNGKLEALMLEGVPNLTKQLYVRQLGLIDILMHILYLIQKQGIQAHILTKKDSPVFQLLVFIIDFVRLICRNNIINSQYTSCWYYLLKNIILSAEIPPELKIDKLFEDLFRISKINITYINDVGIISKTFQPENHNIQGLKLLLGFCKDMQELDTTHQKNIIKEIFEVNQDNLFRRFDYNIKQKKLMMVLSETSAVFLDEVLLQHKPEQHEFMMTLLHLSSEVCKSQSNLIIEYIANLYPMQACIYSFSNKELNPQLRALILNIFQRSYLRYDSRYVLERTYPISLKKQFNLKISNQTQKQIQEQKELFEFKYCRSLLYEGRELVSVNLKDFIIGSLLDLKTFEIINIENMDGYIHSLIKMLQQLMVKDFFNKKEVETIHVILDDILKVTYTFLYHLHKNAELNHFDIHKTLIWIIQIFEILDFIELFEQNEVLNQFFTIESNNQIFINEIEEILIAKNMSIQDFNQKLFENQIKKKENIMKFLTCLSVLDVETVFYYLKFLTFMSHDISQVIVKLIFKIFKMKTNILSSFNSIYFIHQENANYCYEIQESYHKLYVLFIDINSNLDPQSQLFIDKVDSLYEVLIEVCKNLYVVYVEDIDRMKLKTEQFINDELNPRTAYNISSKVTSKSNQINKRYKSIVNDDQRIIHQLKMLQNEEKHQQIKENHNIRTQFLADTTYPDLEHIRKQSHSPQEPSPFATPLQSPYLPPRNIDGSDKDPIHFITSDQVSLLRGSNITIHKDSHEIKIFEKVLQFKHTLKSTMKPHNKTGIEFFWIVLDEFMIDIRYIQKQQDLLRHLNMHTLMIQLIIHINSYQGAYIDSELKEEIIEKCLLILIYFCMKNIKNSNLIAESPDFQELYKILLIYKSKYQDMNKYILQFLGLIFKDNYQLLINFAKDQEQFITRLAESFKRQFKEKNYEYCIYNIQILQTFFRVKSAQLIQNKIWIFDQLYKVHSLQIYFQKLVSFCWNQKIEKYKLEDKHTIIAVSDEMTLLCYFLNLLTKLNSRDKNSNRMLAGMKNFFPLELIKKSLKNLDDFYFLKLEMLQFLTNTYIKSKKLDEKEIHYIMILYKEEILHSLQNYIDNYHRIENNTISFENDKSNIFNEFTGYSTPEKLINIPFNKAADLYIYSGLVPACEAYREKYLENNTFNQLDFKFMELFETKLNNLIQLSKKKKIGILRENVQNQIKSKKIATQLNKLQNTKKQNMFVNIVDQKINDNEGKGEKDDDGMSQYKELKFKSLQKTIKVDLIQLKKGHQTMICQEYMLPPVNIERLELIWDKLQSFRIDIIDREIIEKEKLNEINTLIGLLVNMRKESLKEFKCVIQNIISLLTASNTVEEIRKQAVIILRELANFKANEVQGKGIRNDLCEMGFTNFLCQVISNENTDQNDKLEYIITLIDFLDEGDNIQQSVMDYMYLDKNNIFLLSIKDYIQNNFNDFIEYENGLKDCTTVKIQGELKQVIAKKINACINGLWIFKMVSEGHFHQMQNFLREQTINGYIIKNNCNIVKFMVKIFTSYYKYLGEHNVVLGEKIIDFFIEIIQGPCHANQVTLSESKILENLEDLMFDMIKDCGTSDIHSLTIAHLTLAPFTKKIYLFIISLFEGSQDDTIIQRIINYLNPTLLLKRLKFIYKYIIKQSKKKIYEHILKILTSDEEESPNILSPQVSGEQLEHSEEGEEPQPDCLRSRNQSPINKQKKQTKQFSMQETKNFSTEETINFFLSMQSVDQGVLTLNQVEEKYHTAINDLKEEGQYIFILIQNMKIQSPTFKERLKKCKKELELEFPHIVEEQELLQKTMLYFKLNTLRIEIINSSNFIQIVYFPKPELSQYLSESSKENFLETVNRQSANEKIMGLINSRSDFIDEMKHYKFLMNNIPVDMDKLFTYMRLIALLCAFMINFLLLFDKFTVQCEECLDKDPHLFPCVCDSTTPTLLGKGMDAFGFFLSVINVFSFALWAVLKLKLDLLNALNQFKLLVHLRDKSNKTRKNLNSDLMDMPQEMKEAAQYMQLLYQENVEKYIYVSIYLCINSYFLYLSAFALLTVIGQQADKLFYSFLLLDIVQKSSILQITVASVTVNANQLLMTCILGINFFFIYSMLAYYNEALHATLVGSNVVVPVCTDGFNCFLAISNMGLRAGGGFGDIVAQPDPLIYDQYIYRFFFDISFYLLIIIVWTSVIFSIIYDSFGALRNKIDEVCKFIIPTPTPNPNPITQKR